MIEIILKKNKKKLGKKYNIIKVKSGYALNYLIPKNYAIIATKDEIKKNNEKIKIINRKKKEKIKKYKKYINLIKKLNLKFYLKKKKGINKKKIIKYLKNKKILIKKKNIFLKEKNILIPGEYKIKIFFSEGLETFLKINLLSSNT
ncbi:MAG: 50S ribosomal protein L9 [Candidatus Shikimatogenerans sp. JK-2022]|nr:50S ribosomal protein L9 [Candidatus Shikimatogenerans bostrichidophilus]